MIFAWTIFILVIVSFLVLDLYVFHKQDKLPNFKDSALWSLFWIGTSFAFNTAIYLWWGPKVAMDYLTGYVIEKSLSVDNLFVFLMIFKAFSISPQYQHRILFWGIMGALILRVLMITLGISLIENFHFTLYIFGFFLVFTGIKILTQGERKFEFRKSLLTRIIEKFIPVTETIDGHNFFIKTGSHWKATPLFMALITIEFSDVIFAVDSVPAVLAITTNPFIVYTSNVFAILGLRSLYFLLASLVHNMRFLDTGLSYILMFVGAKMILSSHYKVPTLASLGIIIGILIISISASIVWPHKSTIRPHH